MTMPISHWTHWTMGATYTLALAGLFALAAGLVGAFALMKKMLLASDVLSHLALPGLGVAMLLHRSPLGGGAITLLLGAVLVWQLQKKSGLAADASIGVVFAAALAIGATLTPSEDLVEALFGGFAPLQLSGFLWGVAVVALVAWFLHHYRDQLTLMLFSPELAAVTGVKVERLELLFLLIFSLTILVGLRFMGALLSSALIILPAATARQLTSDIGTFVGLSSGLSLAAVVCGFGIAVLWLGAASLGPATVIVSAIFFGGSWALRRG